MGETIRDYIKRRVRWAGAIAIAGWLTIALSMGLGPRTEGHGSLSPITVLGFVAFIGAILSLQFGLKCPKCSRRIAQSIGFSVGLPWSGEPPNYCPYCGVNLDTPLGH
jgi:hypothetical protein